jgi:DNA-binding response OmpR family regulator
MNMQILLIEDDLDVAASIAEFLEYKNMTVDFAYDVKQAKSLLQSATFDLIIMDINLPDGNGINLCRELIEQHNVRQPILFLSAKGTERDKLAAFESGAVDFVVKPFSMLELEARIRNIKKHFNAVVGFEASVGPLTVCLQTGKVKYANEHIQVNKTGIKILHALTQSHPNPVNSQRLCSLVWGDDIPESNPLRAHISRLNSAFEKAHTNKLIGSIRGIGYHLNVTDNV